MKNSNLSIVISTAVCFVIALLVFRSLDRTEPTPPPSVPVVVTPAPVQPSEIGIEEALATITEAELKSNLYYLASQDLEGRMSGKKGNVVAAEFIKKEFEKYGLPTEYDRFNIKRLNPGPKNETGDDFTQNIYAWIEGSDPVLKNEIVVIGAHMDHIGYGPSMSRSRRIAIHPGADDNASGTVAIMEIAQALARTKPKRTIVIQSYSAEEMGLIGSRHYCNHPTFPRNNPSIKSHVGMVNLDMVGYLDQGYYFAGFNEGDSSVDLGKIIAKLNSKYSFAKKITSRGSGGSDHASFYNSGVPVAFLHTGLHDYYHTPDDTADKINYTGMEQVARYACELVWEIANADSRPQFNYAAFKPMEYVHDHGHPDMPFYHHYHRHDDHSHNHSHP